MIFGFLMAKGPISVGEIGGFGVLVGGRSFRLYDRMIFVCWFPAVLGGIHRLTSECADAMGICRRCERPLTTAVNRSLLDRRGFTAICLTCMAPSGRRSLFSMIVASAGVILLVSDLRCLSWDISFLRWVSASINCCTKSLFAIAVIVAFALASASALGFAIAVLVARGGPEGAGEFGAREGELSASCRCLVSK